MPTPHTLASTFTSRTYDQTLNRLIPDRLGDFDLTSIDEYGTIGAGCRRRQSGQPITGEAREINPDPMAYQVEINQALPHKMQYKGIAFFDDPARQEVTRIAGFVKYIPPPNLNESQINEIRTALGLRVDQDETTWVVTKP